MKTLSAMIAVVLMSPLLAHANPINLNPEAEITGPPVIAADGQGHVGVVWPGDPGVGDRIWDKLFQAYSTNNGTSFTASSVHPYSATSGYHRNLEPSLMYTFDGVLHLAWSYWDDQKGYVYSQSTDHGSSWTEIIDTHIPETTGRYPRYFGGAMASANVGQTIRDIWYSGGSWFEDRVYTGLSTDGGLTWVGSNITTDLSEANSNAIPSPTFSFMSSAVYDSQGNFYALSILGNTLSRIAVTRDISNTWDHVQIVSYPRTGADVVEPYRGGSYMASEHALLIDDNDTLYAVWSWNVDTDPFRVFFTKSSDMGATWSTISAVVNEGAAGDQLSPVIGMDSEGTLYLAWEDTRDGVAQIRMSTSTDGGVTWSASQVVSASISAQESPDMFIADDDTVHFAWIEDGCPYYYKLGGSSTTPGDANDDGVVNLVDFSIVANNWLAINATLEMGDFNGDQVVNSADLDILMQNWSFGS